MWGVLLKLCFAAIAGLVLGIEREAKHKPLGLKTCVVISVASCMLTIISIEAAIETYDGTIFVRADPMRLAAQIVSGIGFLGAGVIIRRSNDVISGLTTAAIVWAASGIGIATGAGYYQEVIFGVIIIVSGVRFLPYIVQKIGPKSLREQEANIKVFVESTSDLENIVREIRELVGEVKNIKILGKHEGHKIELSCAMKEGTDSIFNYYTEINKIPGVIRSEIEGR